MKGSVSECTWFTCGNYEHSGLVIGITIITRMCSVSTNGERASPAQQQGSQLIGCHFSYLLL